MDTSLSEKYCRLELFHWQRFTVWSLQWYVLCSRLTKMTVHILQSLLQSHVSNFNRYVSTQLQICGRMSYKLFLAWRHTWVQPSDRRALWHAILLVHLSLCSSVWHRSHHCPPPSMLRSDGTVFCICYHGRNGFQSLEFTPALLSPREFEMAPCTL